LSAPGLAERGAAAALLSGVLARGRSLADQTGDPDGPLARLAPPERARAQGLATGTLRHLGRIDALLAGFFRRLPPAPVRDQLRVMVADLMLAGTPPHAAVDSAVRLVRTLPRGGQFAGLANAVGRRVAEGGAALWEAVPEAPPPGWLGEALAAEYGEAAGAAILRAHRAEPPLDLTLKPGEAPEAWATALGAGVLPTGSLRLARPGQVSRLPGYDAGAWWVQDAAAGLPVRLLGEVAGRAALDLCAAPGGKTLQLAAAGARVTALDLSPLRMARVAENLARCGLAAETVVADARAWRPERRFEAVLVDAPCSATGTIRRHPDLPFLRKRRDLAPLLALQAALLARAWDWLAPGGRLVFCTCSLLPAEGEAQLAAFRAAHPEAEPIPPAPGSPGIAPEWIDAQGGLRLRPDFWPERGGMDGFYAACLRKPAIAA